MLLSFGKDIRIALTALIILSCSISSHKIEITSSDTHIASNVIFIRRGLFLKPIQSDFSTFFHARWCRRFNRACQSNKGYIESNSISLRGGGSLMTENLGAHGSPPMLQRQHGEIGALSAACTSTNDIEMHVQIPIKRKRGRQPKIVEPIDEKHKLKTLNSLLQKAAAYSAFLRERLQETQTEGLDTSLEANAEVAVNNSTGNCTYQRDPRQPKLVTGGIMRTYQADGVQWLISLYENGLNGILADEMGLGKTVQVISFLAHLWDMKVQNPFLAGCSAVYSSNREVRGPFLVVAPLSTVSNWVREMERWAPSVPVLLYHGSKEERAVMRRTVLRPAAAGGGDRSYPVVVTTFDIARQDAGYLQRYVWKYMAVDEGHRLKNKDSKLLRELKALRAGNRLLITGTPLQNSLSELWSLLNFILPDIFDSLKTFQSWFNFDEHLAEAGTQGAAKIVLQEEEQRIVSKLHAILDPFLLRRLKADVVTELPQKHVYVLFAEATPLQRDFARAIANGTIRELLEPGLIDSEPLSDDEGDATLPPPAPAAASQAGAACEGSLAAGAIAGAEGTGSLSRSETVGNTRGKDDSGSVVTAHGENLPVDSVGGDGVTGAENRTDGGNADSGVGCKVEGAANCDGGEGGGSGPDKESRANTNPGGSLENRMVQLRKCFNHPYLFEAPVDAEGRWVVDERVVASSGKMQLLDRMLTVLRANGHKVLIFFQMTRMMDIVTEYLRFRGWASSRIDGAVSLAQREEEMRAFAEEPDRFCFLLSTRAGGVGINVPSADTVIIYESDFNPQQDIQAQDRCHRIGQTKPVCVYRLVTRDSVEVAILERAVKKRKLELMTINRKRFKVAEKLEGSTNLREVVTGFEDNVRASFSAAELEQLLAVNVQPSHAGTVADEDLRRLLLERGANAPNDTGVGWEVVNEATSSFV